MSQGAQGAPASKTRDEDTGCIGHTERERGRGSMAGRRLIEIWADLSYKSWWETSLS